MKIFANRKVKALFLQIVLCMLVFVFFSGAAAAFQKRFYTPLCVLGMGIAVFAVCYGYFREQNRMLEEAVAQIRAYIYDDRDTRLECSEEGELYRLFHEINSLAAILNAHAENEEKSRKFLQNTISDISHQLKTPLAALNIYNGIIQAEAETKALSDIREFSNLSELELDRIETLVQNLLKITKFDAGTIRIEKSPENLWEMMKEVKNHFSFRAGQEGKEIFLSGSESLSFLCDRSWMVEAVSNLVKNALDHTKRGDAVWIDWGQSASMLRITVRDNGSGIHPEDLHHVFKRFYRSRYSKDTKGIGLGLPLAKSVIEAHDGTVEVDSQLGVGSTFAVYFRTPTKL